MAPIILKNGAARAELLPHRGALISQLSFVNEKPILWLPDNFDPKSSAWPGGGLPFLFPFAGRVQHQGEIYKYALGENVYPMPIHGFSWATPWLVESARDDAVTLKLQSNESSLAVYPFEFSILMKVRLAATELRIEVSINHIADSQINTRPKMPVAVGWHPYFSIEHQRTKLSIEAKTAFPVTALGMAGKPLAAADLLGNAPWTLAKPELQSLILGGLGQCEACFESTASSRVLLKAGPSDVMTHLVTWTNDEKAFLCVEPWMSRPDAVATPSGCRWLSPGESLNAHLSISAG